MQNNGIAQDVNSHYIGNRAPLMQTAYVHLPLGSVKPAGWLRNQLQIQADGLSGYVYDKIPADFWSIENYYEGIVALAYVLDDARLRDLAASCADKMLSRAPESGSGGYEMHNHNTQHALRSLIEYAEASDDPRVVTWLTAYFQYFSTTPASTVFDYCCDGANRVGENLIAAYWLYNRTGDTSIIAAVGRNFKANTDIVTQLFSTFPAMSSENHFHGVDLAQEIKYPGLFYQQFPLVAYKDAVFEGITRMDRSFGQVGGRFAAHEMLPRPAERGLWPTNGTELCAVMEFAYSMERLFEIFGEVTLADRLETLTYNSFPGAMTPDMWAHQYDQQANQVLVSNAPRDWDNNATANCFALVPHFACCLSNMHQGWPRFVENMWMATGDNGLVAVAYGPSRVAARVGDSGTQVVITEETDYPFDGKIKFIIEPARSMTFPLHLRIPSWAKGAGYTVSGIKTDAKPGTMVIVNRIWGAEDTLVLDLPMTVRTETRFNNAVSVLRGPLYFSLRIGQEYRPYGGPRGNYPSYDYEIFPTTPWNYGLLMDSGNPSLYADVVTHLVGEVPFAQINEPLYRKISGSSDIGWERVVWPDSEPVVLKVKGALLPQWGLSNNSADITLMSPVMAESPLVDLELIPYGCTRLRVSEFPVLGLVTAGRGASNPALRDVCDLRVLATKGNGSLVKILLTVSFAAAHSPVCLKIYDLHGRCVRTLVNGLLDPGCHPVTLDSRQLAAGQYVWRMQVGNFDKCVASWLGAH